MLQHWVCVCHRFDSALRENVEKKTQKKRKFKRDNKNKPREMPSHRPVSRFRHVVPVLKRAARDPRFGQRSGKFNETMFKKAYSFLDGMKEGERQMAEKEMRKTRDPERKSQLHTLIQKMDSQKLAEKVKEEKRSSEREQRKGETQLQKEGKKPFFLKKSVRRQLELAKRYKELKESGRLEKYLARKRKRNAQRDRRQLPFKRH
jgi:ribosomal RNA-processing protein 36